MKTQSLYIDGQWIEAADSAGVHAPWDGAEIGRYGVATAAQVDRAIAAASRALGSRPAAHRRAAVLRAAADIVERRADAFADQVCAEAGKPISAARAEVARTVDTLRFAADAARSLSAAVVPMDATAAGAGLIGFEMPEPRGVVAAITPFNFPLNLVVHKIGPALAAGCPVVLKPSEKTPLSAGLLVEAFAAAGLEPGMLNLVTGDPAQIVGALVDDPRVAVITFTGSAAVGWDIKARAPKKHMILELGSNTAMVVTESADIERAVGAAAAGAFTYAGQACISLQRVYVHESVYPEFLDRLTRAAAAARTGDPSDESVAIGPMISESARERVLDWIGKAVADGATVRTGGVADGNVVAATVVADVPDDALLVCEEAFAPVVCVGSYVRLDDAIAHVNRSRFGLNTAIFTADIAQALEYARRAEAGTVLVNVSPSFRVDQMPYGGVKESGQGREGVPYAVQELLERKLVVLSP